MENGAQRAWPQLQLTRLAAQRVWSRRQGAGMAAQRSWPPRGVSDRSRRPETGCAAYRTVMAMDLTCRAAPVPPFRPAW